MASHWIRAAAPARRCIHWTWGRRCASHVSSTLPQYDVVVVGGGVMGSWAAARVSARGASCALLDQFDPGHSHGSSHGDGRIYRLAYTEEIYVDMMMLSLQHWKALQTFAGESLMSQCGGLVFQLLSARGGANDRIGELQNLYRRRGIDHELLSSVGVKARFPQFEIPEDMEGLYQPDMGVLFATKCVQATWKYAASLGAELRPGTKLAAVSKDHASGGGVVVTTEAGEALRARAVVVAPGPWLSGLAKSLLDVHIPTTVTAETVSYFARREGNTVDHTHVAMPAFITFQDNNITDYGYYGLPQIDIPGVKISAHYSGPTVDPGPRRPLAAQGGGRGATAAEEAAAAERIRAVIDSNQRGMARLVPGVESEPFESQNCLYTCTPDHDYIIDRSPGFPEVVLAGGGSGHAFKMGPAIGEACACLALGEPPPVPLEKFRLERLLNADAGSFGPGARK